MDIHVGTRQFLVAAVLGAAAVFAVAFVVALGVRSVVAGPDSAPPAAAQGSGAGAAASPGVPGVSHPPDEIQPGSFQSGAYTFPGSVGVNTSLTLAPDAPITLDTGTASLSRMYGTSLGSDGGYLVNGWNVAGSPNAIPLTQVDPSHQTAWSDLYESWWEGAPLYAGWGVGFTDAGASVRRTPFAAYMYDDSKELYTHIQGDAIYIHDGSQIGVGKIWRDADNSYWEIRYYEGLGEPKHSATLSVDSNGMLTISPESYTSFTGNVGIGTTDPQSALQVVGDYIQFPTISGGDPSPADCDSEAEAGRMVVRTDGTANLYVCTGTAWVAPSDTCTWSGVTYSPGAECASAGCYCDGLTDHLKRCEADGSWSDFSRFLTPGCTGCPSPCGT